MNNKIVEDVKSEFVKKLSRVDPLNKVKLEEMRQEEDYLATILGTIGEWNEQIISEGIRLRHLNEQNEVTNETK